MKVRLIKHNKLIEQKRLAEEKKKSELQKQKELGNTRKQLWLAYKSRKKTLMEQVYNFSTTGDLEGSQYNYYDFFELLVKAKSANLKMIFFLKTKTFLLKLSF